MATGCCPAAVEQRQIVAMVTVMAQGRLVQQLW